MSMLPPDSPKRAAPRRVEVDGVDGSLWHLHGTGMGAEGVILASFKGMYHPQRSAMTQEPAFYPGAIPGDPKTNPQKIDLKLTTFAEDPIAWEAVETAWWSAINDEADATLRVFNRAGTSFREMPIRAEAYPDDSMDWEPGEVWDWSLPLAAYSPGWRGQTIREVARDWVQVTPGEWVGKIRVGNPGDLPAWPEFVLSNTGVEEWTVPDGIGGAVVKLEKFDASIGEIVVNSDPFALQLDSTVESQIAASLLGLRWRNAVEASPRPPGKTGPIETVDVEIRVKGPTSPPEAAMYLEPLYRRPWG